MPDAIDAGPLLLAPSLFVGYSTDSNIFRNRDNIADEIAEIELALAGIVPFRNSEFLFDFETGFYNYQQQSITQDLARRGGLALNLNFSTHDQLNLSARRIRDFSNLTNVDEGGEFVFEGQPYDMNRGELVLQRSQPNRPGYYFRFTFNDLKFVIDDPCDPDVNPQDCVPFFDYTGFDTAGEYRHPLSARRWLTVYVGARRFDHYEPDTRESTSEPFRRELSNTAMVGLRGFLGRGQPYVVRLGYGTFEYEGIDGVEFGGLVGFARWSPRVGARTAMDLALSRRTLPSNFDTFFVNNNIVADISREWLQYSRVGLEVALTRNQYGDPVQIVGCTGSDTRDDRIGTEAYVQLQPHRRAGFPLSAGYVIRDSNCDAVDYDAAVVGAGVTLGWF
jgi:hypothetical protein